VIRVNGRSMDVRCRTLPELLERLGYAEGQSGIAVAVNGQVVRRSAWSSRELRDGDEIEIVGAVQGG
jgi:sulfur carrier protein